MWRSVMKLSVCLFSLGVVFPLQAVSLPVENGSFESPAIDLNENPFGAWPFIDGWTETDLDQLGSQNTGVFVNTPADSNDHIANADGVQLAFLGSATGNGLSQALESVYQAGASYRLTVGVGISQMFAPSMSEPVDTLELALYYMDGNEPVDIASTVVLATELSSTELEDYSVELSSVGVDANWVGHAIGVAIRSVGEPNGFWDLDKIRLVATSM